MKTVAVIVINDPEIISPEDFKSYQTADCYFKIYYTDKTKREYNTPEDAIGIDELIKSKALQAETDGVTAIIVFCFADSVINKAKQNLIIVIYYPTGVQLIV